MAKDIRDMEFNDTISVDTFDLDLDWKKVELLHAIDLARRFQAVVPVWKGTEIRKAYRGSWKR